ncbi:MAG: tagatose-bisphosphate aldolase [Sulfobacillus benefaciens]|uniref:Tagatose-bisphosphate aldolase n=1 Tax=Sulfobacillus benefaciens TaxID=453960 RepID=A0A2T2XCV2_9FIRM|nr:MAG: tagatose-bisphosphate aldolase [Sulfobacillus benefaciens]
MMGFVKPYALMERARNQGRAVCGFNVDSLDMAKGVIEGVCHVGMPSFLQVTPATLDIWGWDVFSTALVALVGEISGEIALHLDHATEVDDILRALEMGFTSVMYDGSMLAMDQNIEKTREVVRAARRAGIFVEAEIGHVGRDGDVVADTITEVAEAVQFVAQSDVDALAIAVGTRHGHVRRTNDLRFDRVSEIRDQVDVPLVLHGASRLSTAQLRQMIAAGITKINLGTELRSVWWQSMDQAKGEKPRQALAQAAKNLQIYVAQKLTDLTEKTVQN